MKQSEGLWQFRQLQHFDADDSPAGPAARAAKTGTVVYAFVMNTTVATLKSLPVSERIQLVEDIWDSIAEETPGSALHLTASEQAELNTRYAAHLADPQTSVPWSEVRANLFKGQH